MGDTTALWAAAVPDRTHPPIYTCPRFWLAVMVTGFFVISLYSGVVAFTDLQSGSYDAGIVTQAVASTAHGGVPPFYESADCLAKSRCSFLLVHPAFVLYAVVPYFDLVPSTLSLMALRAATVALAAIPLYWLTRRVTDSQAKGLLAAGLYLAWAPDFLGDAFSLHVESLLPLELFTLTALWFAGRYRLGLGVAALMFLSFDIFPIFAFLVGAFFLSRHLEQWFLKGWRSWRQTGRGLSAAVRSIPGAMACGLREGFRSREIRYTVLLMAISAAAYLVLASFVNVWGAEVLGVIHPPYAGLLANSSTPPPQTLRAILSSRYTVSTAEYWLILYALAAFIPLLCPRALILSVPWIGWTFLTDYTDRFSTLGHQYSMIAAAPIFIGVAYGLRRVPIGGNRVPASPANDTTGKGTVVHRRLWGSGRSRGSAVRVAWTGALVAVFVANGLLTPINPALPDLGVTLGAPFEPHGFDHSLSISPSFEWVERLVATIPIDATLAVSNDLYPYVANDPHAFVVSATGNGRPVPLNFSNLPFDVSGGPQYILCLSLELPLLEESIDESLANSPEYGLRGYVSSTPSGPLVLFERDYNSPAELIGPGPPTVVGQYAPGEGLTPGPQGLEMNNSISPSGKVIQSGPGGNRTGEIWAGPDWEIFPPGNYTLVFRVSVTGTNLSLDPRATVLRIEVGGLGAPPVNETWRAASFTSGQWTNLSFNLSLLDPLLQEYSHGILVDGEFSVAVAAMSIDLDEQ